MPPPEEAGFTYELVRDLYSRFCASKRDMLSLRIPQAIRALSSLYASACLQASHIDMLTIVLDGSASGRAIRRHLLRRSLLPPVCRALTVLKLPERFDIYLKSRSRQALRTNLRRADERDVRCTRIDNRPFDDIVCSLLRDGSDIKHLDLLREHCLKPEVECWACFTPEGNAIGLALLVANREVAHLAYLCCSSRNAVYMPRWALFASIVENLIARKIAVVLADCVIDTSPGNSYFQHRLGFSAALVRVRRTSRCSLGRFIHTTEQPRARA